MASAPLLYERLDAFDAGPGAVLIVDLSGITFLVRAVSLFSCLRTKSSRRMMTTL